MDDPPFSTMLPHRRMFLSFDLSNAWSDCRRCDRQSCDQTRCGIGAGIGAVSGEALKNADALVEAEETIEALTHGDVSALVATGNKEHKSGFAEFMIHKKNPNRQLCLVAI